MAANMQVVRLQAPAINASSGTTFAGSAVNADGTFAPAKQTLYALNSKSFAVTVPAGSAVVITVQ